MYKIKSYLEKNVIHTIDLHKFYRHAKIQPAERTISLPKSVPFLFQIKCEKILHIATISFSNSSQKCPLFMEEIKYYRFTSQPVQRHWMACLSKDQLLDSMPPVLLITTMMPITPHFMGFQ